MHVFLETDRLTLRRFTEADAELLFDLDGDPEVTRYVGGGRAYPDVEAYRARIRTGYLAYYARFTDYGYWAAVLRATSVSAFSLDWLPFVNLGLSMGCVLGLVVVAVQFYRRKRFFMAQFHALADELKRDLPPVIVGEILTRWDMAAHERRLMDLEAKADWLERRQNGETL